MGEKKWAESAARARTITDWVPKTRRRYILEDVRAVAGFVVNTREEEREEVHG